MKMKVTVFAVSIMFILSLGGIANAQSKCDAGKLKEYGKKVSCLAKLDSKAAKKAQAVDPTKEAKCFTKFDERCAKAEGQGDCTSAVKDCAALMAEADACRAATVAPPSTTTTTTTTTTVPAMCPEDGSGDACVAWENNVEECLICCGAACFDACNLAVANTCSSAGNNVLCAAEVNAAGCAAECCP